MIESTDEAGPNFAPYKADKQTSEATMTQSRRRSERALSTLMVSIFASALSLLCFDCSSGQVGQPAPVHTDEPAASIDGRVRLRPVVSAASGLFIVIGTSPPDTTKRASRREYIGYDAELVILSRPGSAPSTRYTLVSEARQCIASARGRVSLWFERQGDEAQLTEPVEAVELDGCEELEFGEWLVALDGARETARWQAPVFEASFEGSSEVNDIVSSLRGEERFRTIDAANHLARFDLAGTAISALAMSEAPFEGRLPSASGPCEAERHVAISLVREMEVVAAFEAGERLGVLSVDSTKYVVHLGAHRNELRAWQVDEQGIELIADAVRPSYRFLNGC